MICSLFLFWHFSWISFQSSQLLQNLFFHYLDEKHENVHASVKWVAIRFVFEIYIPKGEFFKRA